MTIDPNRNWSIDMFELDLLCTIRAIDNPTDIKIAVETSAKFLYSLRRYSRAIAAMITTIRVVIVVDHPNKIPKAIPARDMCDKVSDNKLCLLKTRNTPIIGANIEIAITAR